MRPSGDKKRALWSDRFGSCEPARALPKVRHLLGAVMKTKKGAKNERPSVLDVAALLADLPAQRLARGQVGTVVEQLDNNSLRVEFQRRPRSRVRLSRPASERTCSSCTTSPRRLTVERQDRSEASSGPRRCSGGDFASGAPEEIRTPDPQIRSLIAIWLGARDSPPPPAKSSDLYSKAAGCLPAEAKSSAAVDFAYISKPSEQGHRKFTIRVQLMAKPQHRQARTRESAAGSRPMGRRRSN